METLHNYIINNEYDLFCQECHMRCMYSYDCSLLMETMRREHKENFLIYQIVNNEFSIYKIKDIIKYSIYNKPELINWFVLILSDYFKDDRETITHELIFHNDVPEETIIRFAGSNFYINEDIFSTISYVDPSEKRIMLIIEHSSHSTIHNFLIYLIGHCNIKAIKMLLNLYSGLEMNLEIGECIMSFYRFRICDQCEDIGLCDILDIVNDMIALHDLGFMLYKVDEEMKEHAEILDTIQKIYYFFDGIV